MAKVGDRYGPYTSARRLGAGGMAHTFLGCRRGTQGFEQRVCIKVMRDYGHMSAEAQSLFAKEANFAALLRHSNIVSIIDVIEDGALVLELVDGVDLRTVLSAVPDGRLPPELVVHIAMELCKALDYAHTRTLRGRPYGIVHRDLSPANVLVSYAGEIKLTDFGIAKAIARKSEGVSTIRGKLSYMAPEQATGQPVDGRTDLFALGVIMYELLAGIRPFDGQGEVETLHRILSGQHTPLSQLAPTCPAGLVSLVERLLHVDPAQRFASAAALMDALADFHASVLIHRELGALATKAKPQETLLTDFMAPTHASEQSADLNSKYADEQGTLPMSAHKAQVTGAAQRSLVVSRHRPLLLLASLSVILLLAIAMLALGVGNRSTPRDDGGPAVTVP